MFEKPLPRLLVLLIGAILIVNALAAYFSWYWKLDWLDMVMHFAGGFWVGGMLVWIFIYWNGVLKNSIRQEKFLNIKVVLLGVLAVGLLWEIFEYTLDYFAGREDYDIIDTVSDMVLDLLGGSVAGLYFLKKIHNQKKS